MVIEVFLRFLVNVFRMIFSVVFFCEIYEGNIFLDCGFFLVVVVMIFFVMFVCLFLVCVVFFILILVLGIVFRGIYKCVENVKNVDYF